MKIRQYILEAHIMNIKYVYLDIQVCPIHIYCGEKKNGILVLENFRFVIKEIKSCVIDVTCKSVFKFRYSHASTYNRF